MKTVVLTNDLTSSDMIGNDLYRQYAKLLEIDIKNHFSDPDALVEVSCPGDKNAQGKDVFEKMGLMYQESSTCKSYYVNPRPTAEQLEQFYKDSKACRFWREEMFKLSDTQLHYLCGSKVDWIMELIDEYLEGPVTLLDYETKYANLIAHLHSGGATNRITVFKPKLYEYVYLLPKEVEISDNANDLKEGKYDVITAFETIERMFDPNILFEDAARICRRGGLLLFTAASCTGLEYQVLGKDAPNLNPINRMNLLSIETLASHAEEAGFEILELSTPGRLDVDIVRQAVEQNKNLNINSFWRTLFELRTEKAWQGLQKFLQENRLSSHVRIAARKL